jgi:hypothetical protein
MDMVHLRSMDIHLRSMDMPCQRDARVLQRPQSISDLKQLSDCLTLNACIPELCLNNRVLELPKTASRVFSETSAQWGTVEMWPLHAEPSERNIREGLFSLGLMRHVGGNCVVCLTGVLLSLPESCITRVEIRHMHTVHVIHVHSPL